MGIVRICDEYQTIGLIISSEYWIIVNIEIEYSLIETANMYFNKKVTQVKEFST